MSVNGPTDADGDTTNFESPYPAFQFLLDASFSAGGVDAGIWVDGHYQYSEFTTAGAQVYQTRNVYKPVLLVEQATLMRLVSDQQKKVLI